MLSFSGGCQFFANYTCTWSPVRDISAVEGERVVVNPLVTTTYSLAVVDMTGRTFNANVTITVVPDCCQQKTALNIVELNNLYVYDANSSTHNDPFGQYPSGTTFHVTGSLKLEGDPTHSFSTNAADVFTMPPGTVLLMDKDAEVYVGGGARLQTQGAAITAACNEMWGGLRISDGADLLAMEPVLVNANKTIMRNRIMHSKGGIVLEDRGPEFHLTATDFLHNYNSLDIDRQSPSYHTAAMKQNQLVDCSFDSNTDVMKAPYNPAGNDFYCTDTHLRIAGNLAGGGAPLLFQSNRFNNSLFGILADRTATPLTPLNSTFSNFLLAGICYASITDPLSPVTGAADALTLTGGTLNGVPNACTFTFRPFGPLPATSQVAAASSRYIGSILTHGTAGIRTRDIRANVAGATFEQLTPTNFTSSGSYQGQAGIHSSDLVMDHNNIMNLQLGTVHDLPATGSNVQTVKQNLFTGCAVGYVLTSINSGRSPNNPATIRLDCNTFMRGTANSSSVYYLGMQVKAFVNIQNADGNNTLVKNKFDASGLPNTFGTIGVTNGFSLDYETFDNYYPTIIPYKTGTINITPHQPTIDYFPSTNLDCYPTGLNGLQRLVGPVATPIPPTDKPQLEQNSPNPTQGGTTTIAYQVPAASRQATLLLRRALDGQSIGTLSLNVRAKSYELNANAYPGGMYYYTLVVDGVPTATRRLVIK